MVPIFSGQMIQRYENLSYKGLEMDVGKTEVCKAEMGLTGIASGYITETK